MIFEKRESNEKMLYNVAKKRERTNETEKMRTEIEISFVDC